MLEINLGRSEFIEIQKSLPKIILCRQVIMQVGPALAGEAVILFERDEQKDKSGSADRRERPNTK